MIDTGAASGIPWIVWTIVVPLAGALVVLVCGRAGVTVVGLASALLSAIPVAGLAHQAWRHGAQRHRLGGWGAPLGIELHADGLSVLMLVMTAAVACVVAMYAVGYLAGHVEPEARADAASLDRRASFWTLMLFLWASMNALFLSADIFNIYVALELVTLSAVALAALGGSVAMAAALRYLLAAVFGSLLYLLSVALVYWSHGTLDVFSLRAALTPGLLPAVALTAATIGLFLKSALFPFHFWLPAAHASAPAPVSALLSALVVKASYYLLLRLWFDVFRQVISLEAATVLGALGAAAIVWGSLQAMLAPRLKLLVAYSTVAQLGYLFLVFPLALSPGAPAAAWHGAVLYALSHACAKAAWFLAAGSILHATGHDRIVDLRGAAARAPVPVFAFGLAGVALMGLPPSGAFVAKWLLVEAAIVSGHVTIAAVIVAGGLLAAAYAFRVIGPALASTPANDHDQLRPVPAVMHAATLAMAVAALLLGLVGRSVIGFLETAPMHAALRELAR